MKVYIYTHAHTHTHTHTHTHAHTHTYKVDIYVNRLVIRTIPWNVEVENSLWLKILSHTFAKFKGHPLCQFLINELEPKVLF